MPRAHDLTGQRFGHLTVIQKEQSRRTQSGAIYAMWLCQCDCGKTIITAAESLKTGRTQSCGCARRTLCYAHHPNRKHGDARLNNDNHQKTRLYRVWCGMRERCTNPHHNRYHMYGARGISVCTEWDDYANFRAWANDNGYDPFAPRGQCTIDRIDVNEDYTPENCRWVDMKTQANNKRERKKHNHEAH